MDYARHFKLKGCAYISKKAEIQQTICSSKIGKKTKYIISGLGFSVQYIM